MIYFTFFYVAEGLIFSNWHSFSPQPTQLNGSDSLWEVLCWTNPGSQDDVSVEWKLFCYYYSELGMAT